MFADFVTLSSFGLSPIGNSVDSARSRSMAGTRNFSMTVKSWVCELDRPSLCRLGLEHRHLGQRFGRARSLLCNFQGTGFMASICSAS
jgi:hypothetical protein